MSFLVLLFLLLISIFSMNSISAFTKIYNYNSTYKNITMFAYSTYTSSFKGCDTSSPDSSCVIDDFSTGTDLTSSDNSYVYSQAYTDTKYGKFLAVSKLSNLIDNKNKIVKLSWLWEGNIYGACGNITIWSYNSTSSSWNQLQGSINPSTDTTYTFNYTSPDYINSSLFTSLALMNTKGYSSSCIATDYVTLTIQYDDLLVNSLTNNQNILNNLSTILNTSQSGYNDTVWYTWNNGIKNYTLCNNSNECQSMITFPRNQSYNLIVYANKSDGTIINKTITNLTIGIFNNIAPSLTNTLSNFYNTTNSILNFTYNISDDNDYLKNISLFLDGVRNITIYNVQITANINNTAYFESTTIGEGLHSWYIQGCDSDNSCSNSLNQTFRIDTTPPILTWLFPTDDGHVFDGYTNKFNISVVDSGVGLSSCWWSNNSGASNQTITCGNNITDIEGADGSYNITFWANDSLNNINSTIRKFVINSLDPAVNLNYPIDSYWSNSGLNRIFNFSVTDTHSIDTCQLWGNWSGSWGLNQSNSSAVSNSGLNYNFQSINISDGYYKWNVFCNETNGRSAWYGINRTFGIDTIYPSLTISGISTTTGSQSITFISSALDTNINNCFYTIYNSTNGADNGVENTTVSCNNTGKVAVTSNYGTYTLKLYARDLAGNENSTTKNFTTTASSPTLSIAGGGGSSQISVVAIVQPENTTQFDNLQRAILYVKILSACNNQTKCVLTESQKNSLIANLSALELQINILDLESFLKNFNNNDLESVQIEPSFVSQYNLFTGVLQISQIKPRLNPSQVDSFAIIFFSDEFKVTIESSKKISDFSIDDNINFRIENVSNNKFNIILKVQNQDFSFKAFQTRASFTDLDGNIVYENINFRVINLKNGLTLISLFVTLGLFIGGFIFRKDLKKWGGKVLGI